jgi:YggT family protein
MGALVASFVLADTATTIQRFVSVFIGVYVLLIFAYILTSWIRVGYSPTLARTRGFLHDTCEPYLRLFRRVIPTVGPFDLSPIVGVFALLVVERVINALVESVL